jgi:hypothetical protein
VDKIPLYPAAGWTARDLSFYSASPVRELPLAVNCVCIITILALRIRYEESFKNTYFGQHPTEEATPHLILLFYLCDGQS